MWIAGAQVNTAGGLEIIKEKQFLEIADSFFAEARFGGVKMISLSMLPPLGTTTPQTAAEWGNFSLMSEKLVVVLVDIIEETVKSSTLPTPTICGKLVKRLEEADRFDEEEVEALKDDIDIETINNLHDPIQVPGELHIP